MSEVKKCLECGEIKPLADFIFDKRYKKYQNRCLECNKKYHHAYYEKRKAKSANRAVLIDSSVMKTCIKCGEEKPLTDFRFDKISGKTVNTCNACKALITHDNYLKNRKKRLAYAEQYRKEHVDKINEYFKNYRNEHVEARREYSKKYAEDHADEIRIKRQLYRQSNREKFRERDREYARTHKEQIAARYKLWAKEHADELADYSKKYREEHHDEISEKRRIKDRENRPRINKYLKHKRETDPLFKLSTQIRSLINKSLKNRGYGKDTHTYEIVGCDYETLFNHLKETWRNNYGTEWNGEEYHIDHIIPLATAKTKQDVLDLCYYENLQMLTPRDNLTKNKNLDWSLKKPNTDN